MSTVGLDPNASQSHEDVPGTNDTSTNGMIDTNRLLNDLSEAENQAKNMVAIQVSQGVKKVVGVV